MAKEKRRAIELKGDAARGFMFAMYQERIDKLEAELTRVKLERASFKEALGKLAFKLYAISANNEFTCHDCDICDAEKAHHYPDYGCMDAICDWSLGKPLPWEKTEEGR